MNPPLPSSESIPARSRPLADLRRGEVAIVAGLTQDSNGDLERDPSLLTRLRDLGFVAGARCEVVARMWLGGDPMAVRIGGSTFALRRAEAAAVRVEPVRDADPLRTTIGDTSAAAA